VTLARGLNILVTAEGVETPEQFERLKALGVDFAQGYLLGRPLPIGELGDQTLTVASPQVDANAA
jgi:EAL domain-containing protein (putative c-di-GMP-specific phosphodiesterase class I)